MILSMAKFRQRSHYPSDGMAKYLSDRFGLPIVDQPGNYDVPDLVFGIKGFFGFCSWRREYLNIARMAKRFVFLCNDYKWGAPSQINKLPNVEIWTQIKGFDFKKPTHYVPWTTLTLNVQPIVPPSVPGLMYYGWMRKERVPLFDKYLNPQTTWISTAERGSADKWAEEGFVRFKPIFKSFFELAQYEWSIYIEDPADQGGLAINNRFFECLSAGVPILFSEECVPTLRSFDIDPWPIVGSQDDVKAAMAGLDRAAVVEVQRHQYLKRDWHAELNQTVDALMGR